ncbi:MAG: outer membrane lipoprotein carrier protein LolA [Sandaracinaceae bacterium]
MPRRAPTRFMPSALGLAAALGLARGPALSGHVRAQDGADLGHERARRVAAQVQAFHDQTTTLRTAFTQVHVHRAYGRTTRSRGLLTVQRPGKLRFDYLGGDLRVIASDGRSLVAYEPTEDGRGQVLRRSLEDATVPSALAVLTGQARLDRDFRFRLVDPARFRWDGPVLEIRPVRAEPAYRRVFLHVDPSLSGVVRRVIVQDHEGNLNRFDFRRMTFDRPVDDTWFTFVTPPGAREL